VSPSALRRIAVAAVVAAGVGSALAADTRFDRGRLFRIERAGTPASYVYGTLHSNDARVATLPPAVTAALDASRSAAFETLLLDADVDAFLAAARYDDGRRLVDEVGPATLARIREALGADAPDTAVLAATKPWAVLLMLAQPRRDGPVALDELLKIEARSRRLAVFGLELPDEQVASLDAVPLPSQLALVEWALATRERRSADLEAATRAWLAGDLAKLRALADAPAASDRALAPHFAALTKHLITDRNVLMAHRLHLPLARGRVFVAVGALHLQGRDGLLALIAKQGYRVTRVL
jgi:uncharacterized protein YbaP (TraB family)